MAKIALIKEGDVVRIKPRCSAYYSKRIMCTNGVVEKCVIVRKPTYTRYFYIVRFNGINKLYHIPSGALYVIEKFMSANLDKNNASSKNIQKQASNQLLSNKSLFNTNRALDEKTSHIKDNLKLCSKAEQELQKNTFTVYIPYTRAFRVAENAAAVRAKLRTVHNLLRANQNVTFSEIAEITDKFEECLNMIYEIASCAVKNTKYVSK